MKKKLLSVRPKAQGLYDPRNEHDACGVGFIAHMKGVKSHAIVSDALTILKNLRHRGACGAEPNTGDGAGILMQIPHRFFQDQCPGLGIDLPNEGDYGVGMVFMPREAKQHKACEKIFEKIVKEEGQQFLGWRKVLTVNTSMGESARESEPYVRQIFIGKDSKIKDTLAFERKLYVIRCRVENAIRYSQDVEGREFFYVSSLSSRTIIYKGMLLPEQVEDFFPELSDPLMESAIGLVHSRFSTNTFPSWDRAHPYRFVAHNGEINTLRGNVNWMHARQAMCESELFGDDMKKMMPVIADDGSDSAMFDNCLEFLTLSGRSLPHAIMMMIPEPWALHETMSSDKKAFYQYHSCLMEPWDGPASIAFTDGTQIGAILDRNGLRPSRYYVTKDDRVIMASEVGVLPIPPEMILEKGRLQPGRMFLIDTKQGRIISDEEIKKQITSEQPYQKWLDENLVPLASLPEAPHVHEPDHNTVLLRQKAFGYTFEELRLILTPMGRDGVEPVGSMGTDTPLAVLSNKPQLLYNYFKQLFAQVTNPPIDCIREEIVTSTLTTLGSERNLLKPEPKSCRQIQLESPVLSNEEFEKIRHVSHPDFKSATISILYEIEKGEKGIEVALEKAFKAADEAIAKGVNLIVLSDRGVDAKHAPTPALLAVSGLHHHLIRQGTRTKVGLILESGEPREVHHFALLLGFGVGAINPYLAFESLDDLIRQGLLVGVEHKYAVKNYAKAVSKGVVKTMSKMGISTIQSYRGAQIFEAVGLNKKLVDKYFTWTATRIEGVGLDVIHEEVRMRHSEAFPDRQKESSPALASGGQYQWRKDGEFHLFNPETIHKLQASVRTKNYSVFKEYSKQVNEQSE